MGLAAGELGGAPVGEVADAEAVEPGQRAAVGLAPRHPPGPQAEGDVVAGAQVGQQRAVLEDHAQSALAHRQVAPVAAGDLDAAGGRDGAGQGAEQGGLAGAVGTDDGDDAAGRGVDPGDQAAGHRDVGVQPGGAHSGLSQRCRRPASTPIETTSRIMLSVRAAAGSACRVV